MGKNKVVKVGRRGSDGKKGMTESQDPDDIYRRRRHVCARKVNSFISSKIVSTVMFVVTIYALFGDDLRLAASPPSADDVFFALSTVALVLFAVEVVMNVIAKDDYLWRFYFWLDLVATISLIPDIGWIWSAIVGDDSTDPSSSAIRAGRASRAGTRAGRIVRIVRLIRLIRIVKLFKHVQGQGSPQAEQAKTVEQPSQVGKKLSDLTTRRVIMLVLLMLIVIPLFDPTAFEGDENQTQTYGLTALQLLMFNTLAINSTLSIAGGTVYDSNGSEVSTDFLKDNVQGYVVEAGIDTPILYMSMYGGLFDTDADRDRWDAMVRDWVEASSGVDVAELRSSAEAVLQDFRSSERDFVSVTDCYAGDGSLLTSKDCDTIAYFSKKSSSVREALLNIGKTLFVMLVLGIGAFIFTRDAENLVIQPIERMVTTVKRLAEDPLSAVYTNDLKKGKKGSDGYEMQLLERTLQKVGSLLQIGFGVAGSKIIAQNLKSGALNPMVKGVKMHGIFGFCDIRQFTDATECLQEGVMVFVNQIGEIVHTATHWYGGAANKNIGDAFLLVWRLPEEGVDPREVERLLQRKRFGNRLSNDDDDDRILDEPNSPRGGKQSEIVKVLKPNLADERRSNVMPIAEDRVEEYGVEEKDPDMPTARNDGRGRLARSYSNLSVTDLTKVSANARFSMFGGRTIAEEVTQLHDNALYAFLKIVVDIENSNRNGSLREYAQHERIQARFPGGYSVRMGFGLHTGWAIEGAIGSTYKIDASYLSPNVNIASRLEAATKQYGVPILISEAFVRYLSTSARRYVRLIDRVTVKGSVQPIRLYTFDINNIAPALGSQQKVDGVPRLNCNFATDRNVALLQKGISPAFFPTFKKGVDAYLAGDWEEAKSELVKAAQLKQGDGPCRTLLTYMDELDFSPPADWDGFRPLTEK